MITGMLKKMRPFLVVILAVLLIFTYMPVAQMGSSSLVTVVNPGFEDGSPLTGWTTLGGTWGTQYTKSTTHKLNGSYSLMINDTSSTSGYGMRSALIAANAYATYEASVGAYADSGFGQLYLEFWDASGTTRLGVNIATTSGNDAWELLYLKAIAPAGTKYVTLLMYSYGANTGICYYDYARLHKIIETAIQNPGFEGTVDSNSEPFDWDLFAGSVMGTDIFLSTDRPYEGAKSLKVIDDNTNQGYGMRTGPAYAQAGVKYQASAWAYCESGTAQVYLEFWQGTSRIGTVIADSTTTGSWEKIVTAPGTAPAGTEYITVLVYTGKGSAGTTYFDTAKGYQYYDAPPVSFTPQVTGHPRLFFTPSELTNLQAKKDDTTITKYGMSFADLWDSVISTADSYMAETSLTLDYTSAYGIILTYPLPLTRPQPRENPPGFTGTRFPYWTWVTGQVSDRMETLSYVYKITGDADYGNKAKLYALTAADWETWTDLTYQSASTTDCLDTFNITKGVAAVYDMCYDLLTTAEREKLLDAMYEKGIRPAYTSLVNYVDSNYYAVRSMALGVAAAVGLGERDFYDSYMYRAYDYFKWYLDTKNTSSTTEGFNYTSFSLENIFQGIDFISRVTGNTDLLTHPYTTTKFPGWIVDFLAPGGGGLVPFSDSNGTSKYFNLTSCILASRGNGLAGWYVKETGLAQNGGFRTFNYLSADGALTTPAEAGLPTMSNVNGYIGYLSMRTGWSPDDQLLALYSGPSNLGHNHYDDNTFVYNVAGEWLLTDPGYYNLTSPERNFFSTQTVGHNGMLINGTGQSNKAGGKIAGTFTSSVVDLGVGNAANSYSTTPGVTKWDRRILSIKPDYYIIDDNIALNAAGTPQLLFHGDGTSSWTSNGTPISIGSALPANFTIAKPKASIAMQILRPSNATRTLTQYTGAEGYGPYASIRTASAVTSENFVTLLRPAVHPTGSPIAQPYTVSTVTSGTVTGLKITLDANTSDHVLLNPEYTTTYTTSNITLTCKGGQGMMRKTNAGAYQRYAIIGTSTTGVNLNDGTQTLAENLGDGSAIGIGANASNIWVGTLRMGATGAPKFYVPSVTQVKLDGTMLTSGQYSYSTTTKLLTINSVSAGDHLVEVTP